MIVQSIGLVKQTNSKALETLMRQSEVLERIQDGFFAILRVRQQENVPIRITCFFEELPLPGIGTVSCVYLRSKISC